MSESEINDIINNFALCIERAQKAGFDGVQLHLAHGYLLSSFLSPHKMKKIPKYLFPLLKIILKRTMSSPKPYFLYNLSSAEEIKRNVRIPVIVVGGVRKIEDIKNIIEQDKSDFVSMSRPFIIEADIVKKFMEHKQTESKCINCNYCMIGAEVQPLKCYYGRITI